MKSMARFMYWRYSVLLAGRGLPVKSSKSVKNRMVPRVGSTRSWSRKCSTYPAKSSNRAKKSA